MLNLKSTHLHFLSFVVSLALIGIAGVRSQDLRESAPTLIPPKDLRHFTLGYHELVSDSLWIRVIQDFDYCEKKFKTRITTDNLEEVCAKGWTFGMLDSITELAPRFYEPYRAGGMVLSVLVRDIEGATQLFSKALKQFPSDGELAYRAAYHAIYEEGNEAKAIDLLVRAGKNGAPPWVFALAAKLSAKEGKLQMARDILTQALNGPDLKGYGKERVAERLAEIEKQLASTPESKPNSSPKSPSTN
jgi:tetratricopeptide (TPR) repeat protein